MIAADTWAIASPMLQSALEYQDTHDIHDIKAALDDGSAQLWCGWKSCVGTEIVEYPKMNACRIWLAAGDKSELLSRMLADIEKWAKNQGCSKIEVVGRKGWLRVLQDFEQPHTVLEKRL